jgi:hypothetical protein
MEASTVVRGKHMKPHQLWVLCHQLVARYLQNIFWDDVSFKDKNETFLDLDPQIVGLQA